MSEAIVQGAAAELWQALVKEAEARVGQALSEEAEAYLVFLLLRHGKDGGLLGRIQALEYLEAFEAPGWQRVDALRDVGDRCLLVSGRFPRLAERRRVTRRYYIDMGQGAYAAVADLARRAYGDLFDQLARGFESLVRVLGGLRLQQAPVLLPAVDEGRFRLEGMPAERSGWH